MLPVGAAVGLHVPAAARCRWPIYLLTFGIPVTYFLEILRGVVLRGADLCDLLPHVAGLAACTAAVLGLAIGRFRKQLG